MRASEFIAEAFDQTIIRMGRLSKDGRIVRILKHQDTVGFSPDSGWLLIDVNPGRRHPENIKWIPDSTKFDWVREFNSDEQPVEENFADGKKPGRKGLAKRVGVNCKQSVSKLRKIAKNSSGEKQRMAHWCANMKAGKKS